MGRTTLILGPGIGGIVLAETLRKLLPAGDRVLVVERERTHAFDAAGPHDGANPERLPAMSIRRIPILVTLAMLAGVCRAGEDIEWRHRATQGAVTLTANPLGVASRAAFYTARGFAVEAIRPYAEACGFSFGMQNDGVGTLSTRLADWRAVGADGRAVRLRLPAEWDLQWAAAQVPGAARIAFRWAQFQAENVFEAGDWIMGMATLETPLPGSFRLIARYHAEKGNNEIVLDNLVCGLDSAGN